MQLILWWRLITHHDYSVLFSVIINLSGIYRLHNIYINLPKLYDSLVYLWLVCQIHDNAITVSNKIMVNSALLTHKFCNTYYMTWTPVQQRASHTYKHKDLHLYLGAILSSQSTYQHVLGVGRNQRTWRETMRARVPTLSADPSGLIVSIEGVIKSVVVLNATFNTPQI